MGVFVWVGVGVINGHTPKSIITKEFTPPVLVILPFLTHNVTSGFGGKTTSKTGFPLQSI